MRDIYFLIGVAYFKILLIRHGQSQGNVEGRMEGWSSTALTPLGKQQSFRLGERLRAEGWHPTQIYCSPLQRAVATLEAMLWGLEGLPEGSPEGAALQTPGLTSRADLPIPIRYSDDLKEYNQGIFNGLTWGEAQNRYPDLCHSLEQSLDWLPIPQAETLADGEHRSQRFVDKLLDRHRNGDRVWVISHHWILQQIIARLMGCDRAWGLPMANTAVFEFWLDCDRWHDPGPNRLNTELWQIKRFNDSIG